MYTYYNLQLGKKPIPIGTWIAIIGWVIATIGLIVFDQLGMREVAKEFLWFYIPFGTLIFILPAFLINKSRVKKIVKELGITSYQYNNLVDKYYS